MSQTLGIFFLFTLKKQSFKSYSPGPRPKQNEAVDTKAPQTISKVDDTNEFLFFKFKNDSSLNFSWNQEKMQVTVTRRNRIEPELSRAVAYELELFLEPFEPKNWVPATLKWRIAVDELKNLQNSGSLSKN